MGNEVYLTKVVLNTEVPAVRRDIADAYQMHSTFMRLADAGSGRPLWRLEPGAGSTPPIALIQTDSEPDGDALRTVYEGYFLEFESKFNLLASSVVAGDQLNFRARVNPTVKREGKRHGLVRMEEQVAWIERQLHKYGARPIEVIVAQSSREVYKKRRNERPIILTGVTFDGVLEIENPNLVRGMLRNGIGHARSFGFGLVTIAR